MDHRRRKSIVNSVLNLRLCMLETQVILALFGPETVVLFEHIANINCKTNAFWQTLRGGLHSVVSHKSDLGNQEIRQLEL